MAEQPVGGESSVPLQRHEPVPAPPVQVSLGLPASPIPVNEPLTHHSPTRVPDSASSSGSSGSGAVTEDDALSGTLVGEW